MVTWVGWLGAWAVLVLAAVGMLGLVVRRLWRAGVALTHELAEFGDLVDGARTRPGGQTR